MAQLNYHPAPGLGEMMPGWFAVPQNPIKDRSGVSYVPSIGEILPGAFVVPQNPIKDYTSGQVKLIGQRGGGAAGQINGQPVGVSGIGGGCGCGGGCGGGSGMGDISTEWTQLSTDLSNGNIMTALTTDTLFGLPVWGYVAVLGVYLMAGGSNSHVNRVRRAARAY